MNLNVTGYAHPGYAQALVEFGSPCELPGSGGWVLRRAIAGTDRHDAMGCYPMFSCRDWSRLGADLVALDKQVVSLAAVIDPFGTYTEADLKNWFPDLVLAFKQHFVVDLTQPPLAALPDSHRRYVKKAAKEVRVELAGNPLVLLEDWVSLYGTLIERHEIKGIARFSRSSFEQQLRLPGIVAFRAVHEEKTVGMLLWAVQGDAGFYHLGAYSDAGYQMRASYALFPAAIEYFAAKKLRWLNLGAGAGAGGDGTDGLSQFKRGWSTGTRTAHFCGRIFDREAYERIVKEKIIPPTKYFPAYRQGEFA